MNGPSRTGGTPVPLSLFPAVIGLRGFRSVDRPGWPEEFRSFAGFEPEILDEPAQLREIFEIIRLYHE